MKNYLAQYELRTSATDAPTAVHVPSGLYIHSRFDPVSEARQIAESLCPNPDQPILLIGHGLGYLSAAIIERGALPEALTIIEPDPGLAALAKLCAKTRPELHPEKCKFVTSACPAELQRTLDEVSPAALTLIAPYCRALARVEQFPLREFIIAAASELASADVYNQLLANQELQVAVELARAPSWTTLPIDREQTLIVVGAGPSLDDCVAFLRQARNEITVIAASGAVPALLSARIEPDIVIAMEALPTVTKDLQNLSPATPIVCFASTSAEVIRSRAKQVYNGSTGKQPLRTRGGTSMIPALDIALAQRPEKVFLIGLDLGQGTRAYAANTVRDGNSSVGHTVAPKYIAMRHALEALLDSASPMTKVYHVLPSGRELTGSTRLQPNQLPSMLSCHSTVPAADV